MITFRLFLSSESELRNLVFGFGTRVSRLGFLVGDKVLLPFGFVSSERVRGYGALSDDSTSSSEEETRHARSKE